MKPGEIWKYKNLNKIWTLWIVSATDKDGFDFEYYGDMHHGEAFLVLEIRNYYTVKILVNNSVCWINPTEINNFSRVVV